ncbi:Guanosine-diphosphatase [Sorochytrium milnesiophthora]
MPRPSPSSYLPVSINVPTKPMSSMGPVYRAGMSPRTKKRLIVLAICTLVLILLMSPSYGSCPRRYGLMIDAGSTGSRIHVYAFDQCPGALPALTDEVFLQTRPGLSSYSNDSVAAAQSLRVLLDTAKDKVPENARACTPIQVKATAGLRLVGEEKANSILAEVRSMLEKDYPFPLVGDKHAVETMDGTDEGVFAWITVNYLLGQLNPGATQQAAIMDLGGASTQIAFLPESSNTPTKYRWDFNYDKRLYALYQHSYLSYGLKEALKQIKKAAVTDALEQGSASGDAAVPLNVKCPCLPEGFLEPADAPEGDHKKCNLVGTGDAAECRKLVRKIFNVNADCVDQPCSFNGVHHPEIPRHMPVFAFSYFYDLLDPLISEALKLPAGDLSRYNLHVADLANADVNSFETDATPKKSRFAPFAALARSVGASSDTQSTGHQTNLATFQHFQRLMCSPHSTEFTGVQLRNKRAPSEQSLVERDVPQHPLRLLALDLLQKDPEFCMGITYALELMQTGYRLGDGADQPDGGPKSRQRKIEVAKRLHGIEMGWCVGATMSMLDTATTELEGTCGLQQQQQ